MMPIVGVSASADGQLFARIAEDEDGSAKVFDVVNFGPYECHLSGSSLRPLTTIKCPLRYDQYPQARVHT